ncbi:MAG: GDSL-type esterase/lipase family protein [Candidatus Woesearchaeota archaeon]
MPRGKKILLAAIYMLFLLACAETALRIAGPAIKHTRSGYDSKADHVILSIGESTTYGLGVKVEDTYSSQLESRLNRMNRTYTVVNKGVPSQTSTAILRTIDSLMMQYKPELVVALLGVNDFNEQLNDIRSIKGGIPRPLLSLRLYKLYAMISDYLIEKIIIRNGTMISFQDNKPTFLLTNESIEMLEYNCQEIINKVKGYGAQMIMLTYISEGTAPVNELIRQIAIKNTITIVEFNRTIFNNTADFAADRWHPGRKGHALIAESIYKAIEEAR